MSPITNMMPEVLDAVQAIQNFCDVNGYTEWEIMGIADRRLVNRLERELAEVKSRFTKLDKPKYSGDPMLDAVLQTRNPEFDAWVASLPPTYWGRYDLSAARIGWEAAKGGAQ
jgi:hypothetical protein